MINAAIRGVIVASVIYVVISCFVIIARANHSYQPVEAQFEAPREGQ